MKVLSREEVLNIQDLKTEEVLVPEWGEGVGVIVRSLTGKERDEYEAKHVTAKGKDTTINMRNARAHLIALSCVDEGGKQLFSIQDVNALGGKNAAALDRIFSVAMKLAGISEEDMKEITEGLKENPFEDSPSG